jgi:hypothetical protein
LLWTSHGSSAEAFLKVTSGKWEIFISLGQFSRQRLENPSVKPISVDIPKLQTLSGLSGEHQETRLQRFPLPWSHYVRLLAVKGKEARVFYETEALRGGWSVRQLDRQIATQFYERVFGWGITFPWPWSMFFGIALEAIANRKA